MSQIIITKGKLLKGDKVEVSFLKRDSADSKYASCNEEHQNPHHKDFKLAFQMLSIHAALLGEFFPLTAVKDIENPPVEITDAFNVSGFTIVDPDGDDEGVILTAQKVLKSGKTLGFNTPIIRFNDDSDNAYPFIDELNGAIEECKDAIREYLNGKFAEDPQGKLFDDADNN